VHTAEGRLSRFGATERASKFAFAELHAQATRRIAANFRRALIAAVPDRSHTVLTDHGTQFTELTHCRQAADQQEAVQHPAGFSLLHACDDACEHAGSEQRLTKPGHPWTNGQVERMNRTLQEATVKRDYYAPHQQLKEPLYDLLNADNCAKRLKPLQGLTPDAYIVNCWQREPERVTVNPCHHTLGLNRIFNNFYESQRQLPANRRPKANAGQADADGDGFGDAYELTPAGEAANGHLVIDPKTLNLKSKGRVITTFVELHAAFNPPDIDIAGLLSERTIPVPPNSKAG
jgi:hypothetical protein